MGDSASATMQKLFYFRVGARGGISATPRRRARRYRACPEGSWEGGGSLVGAGLSVVPCGGHEVSRQWKLHHRVVQFTVFLAVWRNFLPRGKKDSRFWLHSCTGKCCPRATVKPESQACGTKCHAFNAKGGDFDENWMRRRLTKMARRGEASATCRGVISGPRAPGFGKKHVELFLGSYNS